MVNGDFYYKLNFIKLMLRSILHFNYCDFYNSFIRQPMNKGECFFGHHNKIKNVKRLYIFKVGMVRKQHLPDKMWIY